MSAIIATYDPETGEKTDKKLELVNLVYYEDFTSLLTHFVQALVEAEWCNREDIIEHMLMADVLLKPEPEPEPEPDLEPKGPSQ